MDREFSLASKDDLWRLQTEMKNIYATQAEHADRITRLEHRQDNDTRLKSPWGGTQSPFPSILNGTPQQDHGYNPAAEAFKNFDQDQSSNLLGSLHLDTDDEPRRGASRANSVRFDESALHGHFGQASRSSADFFPVRTGSALGSHPMTERTSSHKSDGRQSSTHSARASSFGFESRPLSATVPPFVPMGPPPGLFVLGPVPSIIRCWLNDNFSNDSLLYAAVCSGSYKSTLDVSLIRHLGFEDQIETNRDGQRIIKLPVYLPEATVQQSSSRSGSLAASLPTLTTTFTVEDSQCKGETIQILLGCDVLRTRSAEIHFSLDRLTLFDDDRNKLSVPLVRPENAVLFQDLQTTNVREKSSEASAVNGSGQDAKVVANDGNPSVKPASVFAKTQEEPEQAKVQPAATVALAPAASSPSVIGEGRKLPTERDASDQNAPAKVNMSLKESESLNNGTPPDTPTRPDNNNIWTSWRRDSTQGNRADQSNASSTTGSGYQRAGRGRPMKVLKPSRVNTARSSSAQQAGGFDTAPSRFSDAGKPGGQGGGSDEDSSPATDRRSFSNDVKPPLQSLTNRARPSNPVGGASAFGWLNSGPQKQSSAAE